MRRFLALAQDVVVLEASGDATEVALGYGIVSQLVSALPEAADGRAFQETLASGWPRSPFSAGAELLGMLRSLADRAPVILAIDDAQWMDEPSAGALMFALRRLYANRVLALIVSRGDGLEGLGPSWSRLVTDAWCSERVALAGLGRDEVRALAGALGFGRLTPQAAERLRGHTGGHPLYVKALLDELPAEALALDEGPRCRASLVRGHGAGPGDEPRRRRPGADRRGSGGEPALHRRSGGHGGGLERPARSTRAGAGRRAPGRRAGTDPARGHPPPSARTRDAALDTECVRGSTPLDAGGEWRGARHGCRSGRYRCSTQLGSRGPR
jgi:hypothetical protein